MHSTIDAHATAFADAVGHLTAAAKLFQSWNVGHLTAAAMREYLSLAGAHGIRNHRN